MQRHLGRAVMERLRGALVKTQAVGSLRKLCPETEWFIMGCNWEGYGSGIEAYSWRRPYRGRIEAPVGRYCVLHQIAEHYRMPGRCSFPHRSYQVPGRIPPARA